MVAFILPANSATGGYEISNSLRLNDNDTAYLNRTRSSQSNTTGTFSVWTKMGNVNVDNVLFGGATDVNNRSYIYFSDPDGFVGIFSRTSGSADIAYNSNAKFRDPSAWYHVVVAIDTTQGTAGNRFKMYINGTQFTDWGTATAPSQNASLPILNQAAQTVGGGFGSSSISSMAEGYMADAYYIDGIAKAPTDFGETNDNGVWVPKKYDGSFGTNGFKLEFQQTGTGTASASTIGADTSGNDNHLTSNNLAALDVTVDTPTNNFATLNPLINSNGTYTLSEGNTKFVADGSNGWNTTIATMGFSKGKWYWEQKFTQITSGASFAGLVKDDVNHADDDVSGQDDSEGVLYYANAGNYMFGASGTYVSGGASFGDSFDDGDIISVAADLDNNKMYFAKNGTYQGSGNPSTGSNGLPISEGAQGLVAGSFSFVFPYAGAYYANDGCEWNFGNPPFSISSSNADANGYGNFEFAVPSGYFALCTKNLAEYG